MIVGRRLRSAALLLLAAETAPSAAEPFLLYNHRLFIGARINNVPTEALLDSAAEASLVDPAFAAAARLPAGQAITIKGSGGSARAHIVEGVELEAVGVVMHPEALVITDLGDISRRLVKRPVNAIIGRELFDSARLVLDFRSKTIEVLNPHSSPDGVELPLTHHAGIESIPAIANGVKAQAEFDLGNGSDVLISKAFAERLHLKTVGTSAGGGIGGEHRRDMVELDRLEVGDKVFRHVRAAIDVQPSANDLNIGTKILGDFQITTDFANRRIWLKR
jgi:hypothetical protein